ncbi:unnamed protein product, partial [Ectocarpus sp. 6 AP-2014]
REVRQGGGAWLVSGEKVVTSGFGAGCFHTAGGPLPHARYTCSHRCWAAHCALVAKGKPGYSAGFDSPRSGRRAVVVDVGVFHLLKKKMSSVCSGRANCPPSPPRRRRLFCF